LLTLNLEPSIPVIIDARESVVAAHLKSICSMNKSSRVPENDKFDKAAHGYSLSLRPVVKATLNKRERVDEVGHFLEMREEKPAHFLADHVFVGLRK
jgi:hypothetical protein